MSTSSFFKSPPAPKRRRWPLSLLVLVATAGWVAFGGQHISGRHEGDIVADAGIPVPADNGARTITPRGGLAEDERSTIELYTRSSPSVVHITTSVRRRDSLSLNLFDIPQGTGSGFVWDEEGHVVTNFHVIRDANSAEVTLADQTTWPARLIGTAPTRDLAVLKIDAPREVLVPLKLGDSSDLKVGQKVYAIGNPFGFDQTLTTGIISGLGRELDTPEGAVIKDLIQTDAAINPGNSGGPLLDSAGLLIGVNTAIYSPSGAYAGIGLAIPVDEVNRSVPELIIHGRLIRPGLGISIISDHVARQLGVRGVLVDQVPSGSAAGKAGFRPTQVDRAGRVLLGDVIVRIEDENIVTTRDLYQALNERKVGDEVRVTVLRGRAAEELKVNLQQIN